MFGSSSGPSTWKGLLWRCSRPLNGKIIMGHAQKGRVVWIMLMWSCKLLGGTSINKKWSYLLPTMLPHHWLLQEGFLNTSSAHLLGPSWCTWLLGESTQKHASKNTHIGHCIASWKIRLIKYTKINSYFMYMMMRWEQQFFGQLQHSKYQTRQEHIDEYARPLAPEISP